MQSYSNLSCMLHHVVEFYETELDDGEHILSAADGKVVNTINFGDSGLFDCVS